MKLPHHFWLLILAVFISLYSISGYTQPLLWKATRGEQTLYLMGTIHVGKPDFYPLPQVVKQAFDSSQTLIIEADLSSNFRFPSPDKAFIVANLLNANQKQQLASIAESLSRPSAAFMAMEPWQAALYLQQLQFQYLGYKAEYGIDQHFIYQAKITDKQIVGLESIEFQLGLSRGLPNKGLLLLTEILKEWQRQPTQIDCLVASWVQGDQTNLAKISQMGLLSDEMYRTFVTKRNQNWVKQFTQRRDWQSGHFFVAVGTLHLVGKDNLPQLLRARGYKVNLLTQGTKAECAF